MGLALNGFCCSNPTCCTHIDAPSAANTSMPILFDTTLNNPDPTSLTRSMIRYLLHHRRIAGVRQCTVPVRRAWLNASHVFVVVTMLSLALSSCSPESMKQSADLPKIAVVAPLPGARVSADMPVTVIVSAVSRRGIHHIEVSLAGKTHIQTFNPASSAATWHSQFSISSKDADSSIMMMAIATDAQGKTSEPVIVPLIIAAP